jgi:hypothetical protein
MEHHVYYAADYILNLTGSESLNVLRKVGGLQSDDLTHAGAQSSDAKGISMVRWHQGTSGPAHVAAHSVRVSESQNISAVLSPRQHCLRCALPSSCYSLTSLSETR